MKTLHLLSTAALVATLAIGGNAMASDSYRHDGSPNKGAHARSDRVGKTVDKSGAHTYRVKHDQRDRTSHHYGAPKHRYSDKRGHGHAYKYGHDYKHGHKYAHKYGYGHKYGHWHSHTDLVIFRNGLLLGFYD